MTEPREIRIDLDQLSLGALSWGPDEGPLAVLLHGYPDTAWTWRHLGPVLAGVGWRVVAPFMRGYAPSEVPADGCYAVGALMSDAVGVHTACGGDERAVLVGHDWGAIAAHALGAHESSPFSRIVTLAVPPFPAVRTPRVLRFLPGQALKSWYVGFQQLPWIPETVLPRLVPALWRQWSPGYDAAWDLERVAESLGTAANRTAALGYYRWLVQPRRVPEPYRRWHRTWSAGPRVPTLNLLGDADGAMSIGIAELADARLPDGSRRVSVPDAGHFLHLEQPDLVNEAVLGFVRDF